MQQYIWGTFFPLDYQKSLLNPLLSEILRVFFCVCGVFVCFVLVWDFFAENSNFIHLTLCKCVDKYIYVAPLHIIKGAPIIWYV